MGMFGKILDPDFEKIDEQVHTQKVRFATIKRNLLNNFGLVIERGAYWYNLYENNEERHLGNLAEVRYYYHKKMLNVVMPVKTEVAAIIKALEL